MSERPESNPHKDMRGDWRDEHTFDLGITDAAGNERVLQITTGKTSRGTLVTSARGATRKGAFIHWLMLNDWHEYLEESAVRCTGKAVREQHQRALNRLDDLKARAVAHYQNKEHGNG